MENFISKELSIKLRDIGFNEPCTARYMGEDIEPITQMDYEFKTESNADLLNKSYSVSAPTYEQVKVWFMQSHLIFVNVSCERWLTEFRGEVETCDELSLLPTVNDYYAAFAMAIEEAIKIKKANENE